MNEVKNPELESISGKAETQTEVNAEVFLKMQYLRSAELSMDCSFEEYCERRRDGNM